ncbi:MAG: 50S ribosomal protein L9, partial [Bdellovibrionales bacterium]|nr:50S ribosomal protein L9 [Bdellovibrionales bacterium]
MKVILLESTNNVGMVGEIVNVKPGFARNYLIPNNKAVIANENNLKAFAHQKRMMEKKVEKAKAAAAEVKKQLDGFEITVLRRTAKSNKIFGSVTTLDIQKEILKELNIEVNRKGILLAEPIKKLGSYTIELKLDGDIEASISLIVEADLSAPEAQEVMEEAPKTQN